MRVPRAQCTCGYHHKMVAMTREIGLALRKCEANARKQNRKRNADDFIERLQKSTPEERSYVSDRQMFISCKCGMSHRVGHPHFEGTWLGEAGN